MIKFCLSTRMLLLAALMSLTPILVVSTPDEPNLTKEQIKKFLTTAPVINSRESKKGITHTSRLTLSDGTITHDASFQPIDEHRAEKQLSTHVELGFVDSYKYNIAGYELAELLGLDDMVPVYVERKWEGKTGSLSWWLPVKMDEVERYTKKIPAPNPDDWNAQMYKIRVFDQLVADTDANLTNVLIDANWKIYRIDFTRAFRLNREPKDPNDLVRCDRRLLEKLKALDANVLAEKTRGYLDKEEVKAVMVRRDKIVAKFEKMISEKGEATVLY
jgi:hypothetical protein